MFTDSYEGGVYGDYDGGMYGGYDGFGISDAVKGISDLGTSAINKVGAGKQRDSDLQQSRQLNTNAMIAHRQAEAAEKAKTKRTLIWAGIGGGVVLIVAVIFLVIYLKKNK